MLLHHLPYPLFRTVTRWRTPPDVVHKDIVYASGVHGALMELEKWVPSAGLAMIQMFFPQGLSYNDAAIRDNVHNSFWRIAYHTQKI